MNVDALKKLILGVKNGSIGLEGALKALKSLPFEDLEFATVDTHRSIRRGFPEVIYGEGKSAAQIKAIAAAMLARKENVLVTRLDVTKARILKRAFQPAPFPRKLCIE